MRASLTVAVAICCAVVLAACTPKPMPSSSRTSSVAPTPTIPTLTLSDDPVFSTTSVSGLDPVNYVQLAGDVAVLVSGEAGAITAVDLTTAAVLWQVTRDTPLPGDPVATFHDGEVRTTDTGLVLVPYFATHCPTGSCYESEVSVGDEEGIVALSATDGSVVWKAATVPATAIDAPEYDFVKTLGHGDYVLSEKVLVATLPIPGSSDPPAGSPRVHSLGFDLTTGQRLWRTDGFGVYQGFDTVVYGSMFDLNDPYAYESALGVPAAIDPATGAVRWQLKSSDAGLAYRGTGSDGVLYDGSGAPSPLRLVTADGTERDSPGDNQQITCPPTSAGGRLACVLYQSKDTRLLTLDDDGTPTISAVPLPDASNLRYVDDSYVFVETSSGGEPTDFAVDEQGNRVSADLSGSVAATSDKYVVLQRGNPAAGSPVYEIYART
ncbi:PQQ-binding-like beta-propeller repeat protein [Epidermidibacterium keratini]|uniref:PQQ-binding-like beta-propeller repeat protein n=1 Tax=Epidermidibacterium keratini TaxID=1891644 RepID=A0A7L4YQ21_9ACTN|nr:PQQ-binding-like beta-propeller repeat protein [Epidermidibacterium keratini]QHC01266.1 PQQ-binding-like beta-propeller repeat protein [Epidermidibacterium keratini]